VPSRSELSTGRENEVELVDDQLRAMSALPQRQSLAGSDRAPGLDAGDELGIVAVSD